MALTQRQEAELVKLFQRTRNGEALELESDYQERFWREMDRKGYAHVADGAICGFELVRGTFVTISDAGSDRVHELGLAT